MVDPSDSNLVGLSPAPRCSVFCDRGGNWSAVFGSVLLASGLRNVVDAWDVVDRHLAGRAALAPTVADVRDADAAEPAEASRDDGGDPGRRHRHPRQQGRSPEAREHRRRRWRERRAPVSAIP